jgi:hypothetical protein
MASKSIMGYNFGIWGRVGIEVTKDETEWLYRGKKAITVKGQGMSTTANGYI